VEDKILIRLKEGNQNMMYNEVKLTISESTKKHIQKHRVSWIEVEWGFYQDSPKMQGLSLGRQVIICQVEKNRYLTLITTCTSRFKRSFNSSLAIKTKRN
jgi:hypothetical protein